MGDPPVHVEPESRLPTQPWMKYTGVSLVGALIVWFSMPRRTRGAALRGAWMAMIVFGGLIALFFGIAGSVHLVEWALHG